jgi:hypothetical protein
MVVYLSFDIEADGRSVLKNSMISIGVAAFKHDGKKWRIVAEFKQNLKPLQVGSDQVHVVDGEHTRRAPDTTTMEEFWSKWPEKWEACKVDALEAGQGMARLFIWLSQLYDLYRSTHELKWVAGPATFDWNWLKTYHDMFIEPSVYSYKLPYKAECLSSVKSAYLDSRGIKGEARKEWSKGLAGRPNADPHDALQDAIHQGWEWMNLLDDMEEFAHNATNDKRVLDHVEIEMEDRKRKRVEEDDNGGEGPARKRLDEAILRLNHAYKAWDIQKRKRVEEEEDNSEDDDAKSWQRHNAALYAQEEAEREDSTETPAGIAVKILRAGTPSIHRELAGGVEFDLNAALYEWRDKRYV